MEVTSNECLSKIRSILSCRSCMNVARGFQGNEAQTFIDFLDKVSKSCTRSFNNSRCQTQVLGRSSLDEKLRQRSLRLISKICKAHKIIPASYILQREFIRVGRVYYQGGFADVSEGEYFGCPVAIKCLKMNEGESDRVFRVRLVNLAAIVVAQISLSGYVGRLSIGNICPIRTSYLCWGFPCPQTRIISAFSLSGCQTGM